ncbi:MAG: hypothetical protein WA705_08790 [Candidatus Ozemobacteraceae bacterium]
MEFFGEMDKNKNGRVASEYPAWYYDVHMDQLREGVARAKRQLNRGEVPPEMVPVVNGELARDEHKISEIEKHKPAISVGERARLLKLYKEELCPAISAVLFTSNQMKKGLAPAHEEAKRMVKPIIEIKSEELAALVVASGGTLENKRVSRNTLAKVFKLVGKLLGEESNIEVLRKEQ